MVILDYPVCYCHIFEMPPPKRIYNPIMAMEFLAMFIFQLDNTTR